MRHKLAELQEAFGDLLNEAVAECDALRLENAALTARLEQSESVVDRLIKGMQPPSMQPLSIPAALSPRPEIRTVPVVEETPRRQRATTKMRTASCKTCGAGFEYEFKGYVRAECNTCKRERQTHLVEFTRNAKKSLNGNGAHA